MRFSPLVLSSLLAYAAAQDFDAADVSKEKHGYQSDVSRLRNIVINRCGALFVLWRSMNFADAWIPVVQSLLAPRRLPSRAHFERERCN